MEGQASFENDPVSYDLRLKPVEAADLIYALFRNRVYDITVGDDEPDPESNGHQVRVRYTTTRRTSQDVHAQFTDRRRDKRYRRINAAVLQTINNNQEKTLWQ